MTSATGTTLEHLGGIAIAHQLILARLLMPACKTPEDSDLLEKTLMEDVAAINLGDIDDATAMEVRRRTRDEMVAISTIIRNALGHRRLP